MVVQAIKTGSRVNQLYLNSSDVDYMYEVGPLLVQRKPVGYIKYLKYLNMLQDHFEFYFQSTKNAGFYTICDSRGDYFYPVAMQSKLAPAVLKVKEIALLNSASLQTRKKPLIKENEDSVIALKCKEWAKDIWKSFQERILKLNSKWFLILKDIKGN